MRVGVHRGAISRHMAREKCENRSVFVCPFDGVSWTLMNWGEVIDVAENLGCKLVCRSNMWIYTSHIQVFVVYYQNPKVYPLNCTVDLYFVSV